MSRGLTFYVFLLAEKAVNRPELTTRFFEAKLEEILKDITKNAISER